MSTIADELDIKEVVIFKPEETDTGTKMIEQLILSVDKNAMKEDQLQWIESCPIAHDHPLVEDCFSTLTPMAGEDEAGVRIVSPLVVGDHPVGVLSIKATKLDPALQVLIHGLAKIYSNYLLIIDDSERDTLTGLLNRKTFDKRIGRLIEAQAKKRQNFMDVKGRQDRRICETGYYPWLIMFDIDHFKKVNDSMGHLYGDEVILKISQLMRKQFRKSDLLFRYGGEEFVIVLSPTPKKHAVSVVEKFREAIACYDFPQLDQITVSMGYTAMKADIFPRTLLEHADKALYYSKQNGRNCCHFYEKLIEEKKLVDSVSESDIDLF